MTTLDEIFELEQQCREDEWRAREQARRYEAESAKIQLATRLAVLQFEIAMRTCWALALAPTPQEEV